MAASSSIFHHSSRPGQHRKRSYDDFDDCCLPDNVLCQLMDGFEREHPKLLSAKAVDDKASSTCDHQSTEPAVVEPRFLMSPPSPSPESSPRTKKASPPSLTQLIEETTPEQDDEEQVRLVALMMTVRSNLESSVNVHIPQIFRQKKSLNWKIDRLGRDPILRLGPGFVNAMHTIRRYGNAAAHDRKNLPSRPILEEAVKQFLEQQKQHRLAGRW